MFLKNFKQLLWTISLDDLGNTNVSTKEKMRTPIKINAIRFGMYEWRL